jgi:Sec-independent protein translocase protein TatA
MYGWQLDYFGPMSRLREHSKALAEALKKHRRALREITEDKMRSDLAKNQARTAARAALGATLNQLEASAKEDKRTLERQIADALKVQRTPEESLAYETRAARAWARYKGLLDAGEMDADALVDREKENSETLEVLREELPDYLRTRKVQPGLIDHTMRTLDGHATPLLPETQRVARRAQAELADGWPTVEAATAYAREEHQTGQPWNTLPGWEKGTTFQVE